MVADISPSMKEEVEGRTQVAEAAKEAAEAECPSDLRAGAADVGAVFAAESVTGITSELIAVRRTVGGGWGARVAITAAATSAAVVVGYGAYRLWKWLSEDV